MEGQSSKGPGCKVVLLGDSGVGKKCIITRIVASSFEANINSTNGVSYYTKIVKYENLDKNLLSDVWDRAVTRKIQSFNKIFL